MKLQSDFSSVAALQALKIGRPGTTEIISLRDIATITRGPVEQPYEILRFNGEPVFTVGVSVEPGENVVAVGERVDQGIQEPCQHPPGRRRIPTHLSPTQGG